MSEKPTLIIASGPALRGAAGLFTSQFALLEAVVPGVEDIGYRGAFPDEKRRFTRTITIAVADLLPDTFAAKDLRRATTLGVGSTLEALVQIGLLQATDLLYEPEPELDYDMPEDDSGQF
jgi:hypothetical protein